MVDPCSSLCTKNNSKWFKDLNVRHKILKIREEIHMKTFEDKGLGSTVPNKALVAQKIRARIDKRSCIKLQSFCRAK
jgi:hypothetical protein